MSDATSAKKSDGKWFLGWGLLLLLYAFTEYWKPVRSLHSWPATIAFIISVLASLGLCCWWCEMSDTRERGNLVRRVLGYLLFAGGSLAPMAGTVNVIGWAIRDQAQMAVILTLSFSMIGAGAILLLGSYLFIYKRKAKSVTGSA